MCSDHLLKWGPEEDKVPNHQMHDLVNGLAVPTSAASKSQGMDLLRSMLASASPQQQKQMVGEHLFPLVQKQKVYFLTLLFLSKLGMKSEIYMWS